MTVVGVTRTRAPWLAASESQKATDKADHSWSSANPNPSYVCCLSDRLRIWLALDVGTVRDSPYPARKGRNPSLTRRQCCSGPFPSARGVGTCTVQGSSSCHLRERGGGGRRGQKRPGFFRLARASRKQWELSTSVEKASKADRRTRRPGVASGMHTPRRLVFVQHTQTLGGPALAAPCLPPTPMTPLEELS